MDKQQKEFMIQFFMRSNKAYSQLAKGKGKNISTREEAEKLIDGLWVSYLNGEDISLLEGYPARQDLLMEIDDKGSVTYPALPISEKLMELSTVLNDLVDEGILKYETKREGRWPFIKKLRTYSRV